MSTRQTLLDSKNRVIGYIDTQSDGRQEIQDPAHRVVGYYNPKTNETQDAKRKVIGRGNLLATLLR